MKILFIVEQCNPEWPSVPLVAYNLWNALAKIADVHLVTHARNRAALERKPWENESQEGVIYHDARKIDYIEESYCIRQYYKGLAYIFDKLGTGWPLYHALTYPVYASFDRAVYTRYSTAICNGDYDIVHAFTPVLPRYPVKVARLACRQKNVDMMQEHKASTPFILGPVNGGLPYPKGFQDVQRKEGAHFNFLRHFSRYIPNYSTTYLNATQIFVGSQYTMSMLESRFPEIKLRMSLFHENGLTQNFYTNIQKIKEKFSTSQENESFSTKNNKPLRLLFVGRLVPYKGVHFVLEALALYYAKLHNKDKNNTQHNSNEKVELASNTLHKKETYNTQTILTIVGDGPERQALELQSKKLGLEHCVHFMGHQKPQNMAKFYAAADIFVFPSIREFGGAVVLEAMANGLASIVVHHGGIGEYIDDLCGIRINPISASYIIQELSSSLLLLQNNRELIKELGIHAYKKSKNYAWSNKAALLMNEYKKALNAAVK